MAPTAIGMSVRKSLEGTAASTSWNTPLPCDGCIIAQRTACAHCDKVTHDAGESAQSCPTCLKLKLSGRFCCKGCFEEVWKIHRMKHSKPNSATGLRTLVEALTPSALSKFDALEQGKYDERTYSLLVCFSVTNALLHIQSSLHEVATLRKGAAFKSIMQMWMSTFEGAMKNGDTPGDALTVSQAVAAVRVRISASLTDAMHSALPQLLEQHFVNNNGKPLKGEQRARILVDLREEVTAQYLRHISDEVATLFTALFRVCRCAEPVCGTASEMLDLCLSLLIFNRHIINMAISMLVIRDKQECVRMLLESKPDLQPEECGLFEYIVQAMDTLAESSMKQVYWFREMEGRPIPLDASREFKMSIAWYSWNFFSCQIIRLKYTAPFANIAGIFQDERHTDQLAHNFVEMLNSLATARKRKDAQDEADRRMLAQREKKREKRKAKRKLKGRKGKSSISEGTSFSPTNGMKEMRVPHTTDTACSTTSTTSDGLCGFVPSFTTEDRPPSFNGSVSNDDVSDHDATPGVRSNDKLSGATWQDRESECEDDWNECNDSFGTVRSVEVESDMCFSTFPAGADVCSPESDNQVEIIHDVMAGSGSPPKSELSESPESEVHVSTLAPLPTDSAAPLAPSVPDEKDWRRGRVWRRARHAKWTWRNGDSKWEKRDVHWDTPWETWVPKEAEVGNTQSPWWFKEERNWRRDEWSNWNEESEQRAFKDERGKRRWWSKEVSPEIPLSHSKTSLDAPSSESTGARDFSACTTSTGQVSEIIPSSESTGSGARDFSACTTSTGQVSEIIPSSESTVPAARDFSACTGISRTPSTGCTSIFRQVAPAPCGTPLSSHATPPRMCDSVLGLRDTFSETPTPAHHSPTGTPRIYTPRSVRPGFGAISTPVKTSLHRQGPSKSTFSCGGSPYDTSNYEPLVAPQARAVSSIAEPCGPTDSAPTDFAALSDPSECNAKATWPQLSDQVKVPARAHVCKRSANAQLPSHRASASAKSPYAQAKSPSVNPATSTPKGTSGGWHRATTKPPGSVNEMRSAIAAWPTASSTTPVSSSVDSNRQSTRTVTAWPAISEVSKVDVSSLCGSSTPVSKGGDNVWARTQGSAWGTPPGRVHPVLARRESIPAFDFSDIMVKFRGIHVELNDPLVASKALGIQNRGNRCYMIALVQALFVSDRFLEDLFDKAEPSKMAVALRNHVARLLVTTEETVEINQLFEALPEMLNDGMQQDAMETIRYVLSELQESSGCFRGSRCITTSCTACGNSSVIREDFQELCLPCKKMTVGDLLKTEMQAEVLSGSNQWNCQSCQRKVDAQRSWKVEKYPEALLLNLNRFRWENFDKVKDCTHVKLEPNIHFGPVKYELYACVIHSGRDADSGHYYTTAKRVSQVAGNCWRTYDDIRVRKVDGRSVAAYGTVSEFGMLDTDVPYILMYRRI